MKKIILIALLALTTSCKTTKFTGYANLLTGNVETEKTLEENYIAANEFMVENFNHGESVIQFSDKEAGIVKGKYFMGSYRIVKKGILAGVQNVYCVVTIRVKDGAAKIEVDGQGAILGHYKDLIFEDGFTNAQYKEKADWLIGRFKSTMLIDDRNKW